MPPVQILDGTSPFTHSETLGDEYLVCSPSNPNSSSPSSRNEALDARSVAVSASNPNGSSSPISVIMSHTVQTLDGSSLSLHEQLLVDHSLVHSPSNSDVFLPISIILPPRDTLDDQSLPHSPSNPNGVSLISTIGPHGEILGDSSPSSYVEGQNKHPRSPNPNGSSANLPIVPHSEALCGSSPASDPETPHDLPHSAISDGSSSPSHTGKTSYFMNVEDENYDDPLDEDSSPHSPTGQFSNHLSNHPSSPWSSPCNSRQPSFRETGPYSTGTDVLDLPPSGPSVNSFSMCETKQTGVGAGLSNLGNTCFINSILQCFTHTMLFVQGLRSFDHMLPCDSGSEGFCVLCALRDHIELSLASSGRIVCPWKLVNNLNHFSSFFRRYQQEDAHEFMQCFLDRLERCLYSTKKDMSESSQEDNIVEKVFGGRLVSKLQCCNCGHYSDTYEPIIDLSLEIGDVDTLPSALESFTKVEKIEDPETKFTCENCKEEVSVVKQLMLDCPPSVAAFHLKRFKIDGSSVEKIDKHVKCPLELDLQPYTSGSHNDNVKLKYELYAIVVHIGLSPTSGHYFCFIRSAPDTWYELDDSKVTRVPEDFALSQKAYVLFYARQGTPWFSSLMEAQKSCLDSSILNTSPKSVLDNVDPICASYPSEANIDSHASRDATETIPTQYSRRTRDRKAGDAAEGISTQLQEEIEIKKSRDDTPMLDPSVPLEASNACDGASFIVDMGTASNACDVALYSVNMGAESSPGVNNCNEEINKVVSNDGFHPLTPPGSPSPDMLSEKSPGTSYRIPRDHLKSTKRRSGGKRPLKNATNDSRIRDEAIRYVKHSMPSSRGMRLINAVLGSQQVRMEKRKGSSPYKRITSPRTRQKTDGRPVTRRLAAAYAK